MGRRGPRSLVAAVLVAAVACSSPPAAGRRAGPGNRATRSHLTYEYVYRPGRDDGGSGWRPSTGTKWQGAGRHRQWRGCRHVFDPQLSAFLFGSPSQKD